MILREMTVVVREENPAEKNDGKAKRKEEEDREVRDSDDKGRERV